MERRQVETWTQFHIATWTNGNTESFEMPNDSRYELVNSLDVNPTTITQRVDPTSEFSDLMRQLIAVQTRQNELLQEVVDQLGASQRQRTIELAQWKRANPSLARSCKVAAEYLGKIQSEFLSTLAFDIDDNYETLQDSEYMLAEFFDKYGPRLVHLNTLLQTLTVLGNAPDLPNITPNRQ